MATGGGGPQGTGGDPFAVFDQPGGSSTTFAPPPAAPPKKPKKAAPAPVDDPFAVFDSPTPTPNDPFSAFDSPTPSPSPSAPGGSSTLGKALGQAQQQLATPAGPPSFAPNPKLPPVHKVDAHQIDATEFIKTARQYVGKCFEAGVPEQCANFQRALFKRMGIDLGASKQPLDWEQTKNMPQGPGYANSLNGKDIGQVIEKPEDLQPGDLVFFQNTYGDFPKGTDTHVGAYIGNGKIVHRPTRTGEVVEESLANMPNFHNGIRPKVKKEFSGTNKEIADTVLADSGFSIQDQSIMRRMFGQESNYDHKAVSSMGAVGMGQMMPDTAAPYLAKYGYSSKDYMDNPQVQAFISSQHMQTLLHKYDGDWSRALAAYNGGDMAVNVAMKNGKWNPSDDPNSYYVQTRHYGAQILGVSPEEFERMVVTGTGPKANVKTPSEQTAADRDYYKKGVQSWSNYLMGDAMTGNSIFQNPMAASQKIAGWLTDTGTQTTEAKAMSDMFNQASELDAGRGVDHSFFKDIQEGGKAVARGFLSGMLDLHEYGKKFREEHGFIAAKLVNPLTTSLVEIPDLWKLKTGQTLLQSLQPDANYMQPITSQIDQEYAAQQNKTGVPKDSRGFFPWVANTARWMVPGGSPGRNPINAADMSALAMEIPTLAGMTLSMEMLGPEVGVLGRTEMSGVKAGLSSPGQATFRAFSRIFPKQAASLGREFFENSAVYGAVGAMQMASLAAGETATAGGSPSAIVGAGMAAAFQGYIAGMAFPLVIPTMGGVGAKSGNLFGETISKAYSHYKGAPYRPALEASLTDFAAALNKATDGWWAANQMKKLIEWSKLTKASQLEAARDRTVDNLMSFSQEYAGTAQEYTKTIQLKVDAFEKGSQQLQQLTQQVTAFEQRMPNVAVDAQRIGELQEQLGMWNRAKQQYMMAKGAANQGNPGPLQQFQTEVQTSLGVKDPNKFNSEAHAATKKIQGEINQIEIDGAYDPATIQTYMESKKAQNQLTEKVQAASQDPIYLNRDVYTKDVEVLSHLANKLSIVADNVRQGVEVYREGKFQEQAAGVYIDTWFGNRTMEPAIDLPAQLSPGVVPEEIQTVLDQFDTSLQAVIDSGLHFSQTKDRLAFETTRVSRSLMEANAVGSETRMQNLVFDLQNELAALESNKPKLPSKPSKKNLSAKDWEAASKQWEQTAAKNHKADMVTWAEKTTAVKQRLKSAQQAQSILFGTKFSEPGRAKGNIVAQAAQGAEEQINKDLLDAGVKGGIDQLDSMLDITERPQKRVDREMRSQWADGNKKAVEAAKNKAVAEASQLKGKKGKPVSQGKQNSYIKKAVNAVRRQINAKRNLIRTLGNNNNGWVEAEVPTAWLHSGNLNQAEIDGAKYINEEVPPRKGKERPIFLGDIDTNNGNLQVVDGNKRIALAVQQGAQSVKALIPKDVWEATLAGRLDTDLLARIDTVTQENAGKVDLDGNPLRPSYSAGVRSTVQAEAEQWYNDLNPVQRGQMLADEVANIAQAFQNWETPSLARQTTIMAGAAPASWVQDLDSRMQQLLMNNTQARQAMQSWMEYRNPASLKEMWARSFNRLKQYVHEEMLGRQISTAVSHTFRGEFEKALSTASERVTNVGTFPGNPAGRAAAKAERQSILSEEMVDALQQMPQTNQPITQFLQKYPEMRDSLGAYFGMLKTMEQWKIVSPELKPFFNEVGFAHIFPRMQEIIKAGSMSNRIPTINTRLASEEARKYPTLKEAREAYTEASDKIAGGNWRGKKPGTRDEMEKRFINATPTERMEILGLDPGKRESAVAAERTLLKLGLRNPLTDPAEVIRRQIQSTMYADTVRSLLSDLAQLPIPGLATLDPRTGKPYTVLSHFPAAVTDEAMHGSAPLVPTISTGAKRPSGVTGFKDQQMSKKMVALTDPSVFGLSEHAVLDFGGQQVSAKELFIHPDIADLIKSRIITGNEGVGGWANIMEATRLGSLLGAPLPHGINIAVDHWGAMAGHALGVLADDLFPRRAYGPGSGPKNWNIPFIGEMEKRGFNPRGLLNVPQTLIDMPRDVVGLYAIGNDLATNTAMLIDATQHGVSLQTWNSHAKAAVEHQIQFLRQEAGDLFTEEELTGIHGLAEALMQKADSADQAFSNFKEGMVSPSIGTKVKTALNSGVNAEYFVNKYAMFEPIRQAQLAAYTHWTAVHWKDMGQKLMDEGIPKYQALRIVKEEAANYVNLISGVTPHYKDMAGVRKFAYGMPGIGPMFSALTPGWLRSKVHALMSVMDPIFDEHIKNVPGHGNIENPLVGAAEALKWDRRTMGEFSQVESARYKDYLRKQWAKHWATQIVGSFAGLQVASFLINGATSIQMNPDNVKKWFSLRMGDRDYSWTLFGIFKDTVHMLRGASTGDIGDMLSVFTQQLVPTMDTAKAIVTNDDGAGGEIYSKDRNLMTLPEKGYDVGKYLLSKYLNPEDTLGISMHPYPFAGMRESSNWGLPDWMASQLGMHPSQYNQPLSERSYEESLIGFQRQHMQEYVRVDLERWARNHDREALDRAIHLAMIDGIQVHGDTKEVLKYKYPDGRFRMSDEAFRQMLAKVLDPTGYSLDKLDPAEKAWLWNRINRYQKEQGNLGPAWAAQRAQLEQREK